MYTLIEIFDAKQYENVITPICLEHISKLIYVGSKEVMTNEKIQSLKRFFSSVKFNMPMEFLYVERDNENSIKNRFTQIVKHNQNCIFDATGGEDVILTNVGVIAERFTLPIIRINTKNKKCVCVHGTLPNLTFRKPSLTVSDFITLEGGRILLNDTVSGFTAEESDDIASMFKVNSADCEAYSAFCNIICEFLSHDGKILSINKADYQKKLERTKYDLDSVFERLLDSALLKKADENETSVIYKTKSRIVPLCMKKSGNILEYYTAIAASSFPELSDIRVSVSIEWDISKNRYETQNEIDVMAISDGLPLFISCKNGEVKKDALYELDAVSRALGGIYAKKVLVCTYISKNRSARDHFIKRAKDMGIQLVYNSHKKDNAEFIRYLKIAVS